MGGLLKTDTTTAYWVGGVRGFSVCFVFVFLISLLVGVGIDM